MNTIVHEYDNDINHGKYQSATVLPSGSTFL